MPPSTPFSVVRVGMSQLFENRVIFIFKSDAAGGDGRADAEFFGKRHHGLWQQLCRELH